MRPLFGGSTVFTTTFIIKAYLWAPDNDTKSVLISLHVLIKYNP